MMLVYWEVRNFCVDDCDSPMPMTNLSKDFHLSDIEWSHTFSGCI